MEISIKLADPTPHELAEYRKLEDLLYSSGNYQIHIIRSFGEYAMSEIIVSNNDTKHKTRKHTAIYPSVPNRGTAQMKADILALTFAMRELGFNVSFLGSDPVERERVTITRGRLESCNSLKELVNLLEDAGHEKLDEVKVLIENKRKQGGRPSKKAIVEMLFTHARSEKQAQPVRTGLEWAQVKNVWRDRFHTSKYAKMYKSLDEFCTFASEEECKS